MHTHQDKILMPLISKRPASEGMSMIRSILYTPHPKFNLEILVIRGFEKKKKPECPLNSLLGNFEIGANPSLSDL
jgi:hypothetical protein